MIQELREVLATSGATFEADIAVSFGNDAAAVAAAKSKVALCDRTHWGVQMISKVSNLVRVAIPCLLRQQLVQSI
jgi:tRNA-modifying protein YgfZ